MGIFDKKHTVSPEHARAWTAASTDQLNALRRQLETQRDHPSVSTGVMAGNLVTALTVSPESTIAGIAGAALGNSQKYGAYLPKRVQGPIARVAAGTALGAIVSSPVALLRYNHAARREQSEQAAADLGFVDKVLEDRAKSTARLTAESERSR